MGGVFFFPRSAILKQIISEKTEKFRILGSSILQGSTDLDMHQVVTVIFNSMS